MTSSWGGVNRNGVRKDGAVKPEDRPKHRKRKVFDRSRGIFDHMPNDEVAAHLRWLMRDYMTLRDISRRSGILVATLDAHAYPTCRSAKTIMRGTAEAVLAVQPRPGEITYAERTLGVQRIIRGLVAKGFPQEVIAEMVGRSVHTIVRQRRGQFRELTQDYYDTVMQAAVKLDAADPFDYAIARTVRWVKSYARNQGWPPLAAWDLETIHRDDVFAEWTGKCGTVQGYRIHLRNHGSVDMCTACRNAKEIYRRFPKLAVELGISSDSRHDPAAARATRNHNKD